MRSWRVLAWEKSYAPHEPSTIVVAGVFCAECGTILSLACPSCGSVNEAGRSSATIPPLPILPWPSML
jgi:hypothetical protein